MNLRGIVKLTGAKLIQDEADANHFRLEWAGADFCDMRVEGDTLWFRYLVSKAGKHRLAQLVACLPAFFRERGITRFATSDSDGTPALLSVGFERVTHDVLAADIAEGCRMDEYTAWRAGTGPQPDWRSEETAAAAPE